MATPKATAQQIATFALRQLGVVNRRSPVADSDMRDALEGLWMLMETLSIQNATIPFYTQIRVPLGNTQTYTVGPSGDVDVDAPIEILDARIDMGDGTTYPVDVVNGIKYFNSVNPSAGSFSGRPYQLIWNPTVPCNTITLNMIPTGTGDLILYCLMPWSVEIASNVQPSVGQTVDAANYNIDINATTQPYCDGDCQLNVMQQMTTWLGSQNDYGVESYSQSFSYNGLSVVATAALAGRTTPSPISIGVPREMEFPIGYSPLLMWGLSQYLLAQYPQDNPVTVQMITSQAAAHLNKIKTRNYKPATQQYDPSLLALHSGYNYNNYVRR